MKITVITLFPKMVSGFFAESIVKRAVEKKLMEIEIINLRDFAVNDYGSVDDRPYGGGAGMILRADVVYAAIQNVKTQMSKLKSKSQIQKSKTVLTSPKGKQFNQQLAIEYSKLDNLIIIAGHYEGVDERIMDYVDEEVSLGDFVMTGGEITAAAIVDAIVRLLPGALKKEEATQKESFCFVSINQLIDTVGKKKILLDLQKKGKKNIKLLEYPQYTRPQDFQGKKVPAILLRGNHKEIEGWRLEKAFKETLKKRKDLFI